MRTSLVQKSCFNFTKLILIPILFILLLASEGYIAQKEIIPFTIFPNKGSNWNFFNCRSLRHHLFWIPFPSLLSSLSTRHPGDFWWSDSFCGTPYSLIPLQECFKFNLKLIPPPLYEVPSVTTNGRQLLWKKHTCNLFCVND